MEIPLGHLVADHTPCPLYQCLHRSGYTVALRCCLRESTTHFHPHISNRGSCKYRHHRYVVFLIYKQDIMFILLCTLFPVL